MAYDTSNLKNNRGGATLEVTEQAPTPAGLYRHPDTGKEIITLYDPLFGDAQSEGVVRLGFVRVGDANPNDIKTIVDSSLEARHTQDTSLKGLEARMAQMEGVHADNIRLQAEVDELRKEKLDALGQTTGVEKSSADTAKENATVQTNARTEHADVDFDKDSGEMTAEQTSEKAPATPPVSVESGSVVSGSPATGDQGDGSANTLEDSNPALADEKPLSQQNKTELKETAAAEGVEVADDDTNKQIVEKIEAKRIENDASEDDGEESENN